MRRVFSIVITNYLLSNYIITYIVFIFELSWLRLYKRNCFKVKKRKEKPFFDKFTSRISVSHSKIDFFFFFFIKIGEHSLIDTSDISRDNGCSYVSVHIKHNRLFLAPNNFTYL